MKLREAVARHLAWTSIKNDEDSLELTNHDKNQVATKVQELENTVTGHLGETWSRLLIPRVKDPKSASISWEILASPGKDDKIDSSLKRLTSKDLIYDQFGPFHLKRELERHLWGQRDHISTGEVASASGTYLYFPRLLSQGLLTEAIQNAFSGQSLLCEFFGYAEAFDPETEKYLGLCANKAPISVTIGDSVLIKDDVAMACASAASDATPARSSGPAGAGDPVPTDGGNGGQANPGSTPPTAAPKTR